MLSEFECQACKTRFVVASTQNAAQLPTVFCVYCGHRSLRYIGSKKTDNEPTEDKNTYVQPGYVYHEGDFTFDIYDLTLLDILRSTNVSAITFHRKGESLWCEVSYPIVELIKPK